MHGITGHTPGKIWTATVTGAFLRPVSRRVTPPSYPTKSDVVTITNTATLIQTGQLNWPIPVLGSPGALMIFFGIMSMRKMKKNGNA